MKSIRRLVLTSVAALAFVGMTVATSHADCNDTGNRRSSYGQATGGALPSDSGNMENPASSGDRYLGGPGNYSEQGVPGRPVEHLGAGAGGQIQQTAPYGSSSYQGCNCSNVQSNSQYYSGQGAGGFTGTQSPCYQGTTSGRQLGAGAGAQVGPVGAGVGAGAGSSQIGAGTGGYVGCQQYQQSGTGVGAGTGGYVQSECQTIGSPCYKAGPVWSSDGSVGAGAMGPDEYQSAYSQSRQNPPSSEFQSGQAGGGYVGQQNLNQSPCSSVGTGTGGYVGTQQSPQSYQQYQQGSTGYQQGAAGYQQGYQQNFQGQATGGTQSPCYSQQPCCQGNTMGTGTGGMTGTTDTRSGYSQSQSGYTQPQSQSGYTQQQWQQREMRSGTTMGTGAGTGGPCTYTFGSGAGGSMGRDFYGTGFHSWVERW